MTYYCASCKRLTDGYDLWPNGECCACYSATEDLMARDANPWDAKVRTVSYRFPVPHV